MLLSLVLQAAPAVAHLVLANAAQYGRNGPNVGPVRPQKGLTFDEWWFKGNIAYPPKEGVTMNLPSGGVATFSFTCSNGLPTPSYTGYTCGNNVSDAGVTHTKDKMNTPIDKLVDVRGTGIAIAYMSDATLIQPEDFAVITVNYSCPWTLGCDFHIPDNLPPCPEGGCTCMWGWIHSPNAGGQPEMYTMAYRCNITGATGTQPLPPPKVARKCPIDKNNCTVGAKQLHYWVQKERNNNYQATNDPPFYNGDYGFMDGAQTDLFEVGDESLYADNCDWAPGPLVYDGPWSNLAAGRPQWDGVPLTPLERVFPTPVNCTSFKTPSSSAETSTFSTAATSTGTVSSSELIASASLPATPAPDTAATTTVDTSESLFSSAAPITPGETGTADTVTTTTSSATITTSVQVTPEVPGQTGTSGESSGTASTVPQRCARNRRSRSF